jgi:hypothetical protein
MLLSDNRITEERIKICEGCPSMQKNSIFGMTCGEFAKPTKITCGCVIVFASKFKNKKCPQQKW